MKLKLILGLLVSAFSLSLHADTLEWGIQRALHPHMVPFQFEYWVNKDNANAQFAYLKIKSFDGSLIQIIPQLNVNLATSDIEFVDVNTDGRYKIKLNTPSLATRADQQYFVYDSQKNQFIEETELATSPSDLNVFLQHLIARKGVCLAKVKEFGVQDKETEGLYQANQCLNTIAYELIPLVVARNPEKKPLTLPLKRMLETHLQFINNMTVCSDAHMACGTVKNQAALKANIKFVNGIVGQLVMNIGAKDVAFDNEKWLVQWDGLNEIMQG